MFGSNETTTGGNALRYYSSVRLEVRRAGQLKKDGESVGNITRVKVAKNKLAPPFGVVCSRLHWCGFIVAYLMNQHVFQAEFDMMYGSGVDKMGELIDLGVKVLVLFCRVVIVVDSDKTFTCIHG